MSERARGQPDRLSQRTDWFGLWGAKKGSVSPRERQRRGEREGAGEKSVEGLPTEGEYDAITA